MFDIPFWKLRDLQEHNKFGETAWDQVIPCMLHCFEGIVCKLMKLLLNECGSSTRKI